MMLIIANSTQPRRLTGTLPPTALAARWRKPAGGQSIRPATSQRRANYSPRHTESDKTLTQVPLPDPVLPDPEPPEPEPPEPEPDPEPVPDPVLPDPELPPEPEPPLPVLPDPVPPEPVVPLDPEDPADPAEPVEPAEPEPAGVDPVPADWLAEDPAVPAPEPGPLAASPCEPEADVPAEERCRAARRPGAVPVRDVPVWFLLDGVPGPTAGADVAGAGVRPPTTGFWFDDRGAAGRT
jgi:hypothetical protein